jgi:hypothetical protein
MISPIFITDCVKQILQENGIIGARSPEEGGLLFERADFS